MQETLLSLVIDETGDLAIRLLPDDLESITGIQPTTEFLKTLIKELQVSEEDEHPEIKRDVEIVIERINEKLREIETE